VYIILAILVYFFILIEIIIKTINKKAVEKAISDKKINKTDENQIIISRN
jgi:preprotein translocase subunit SecG